jgi:Family of unknown function (DUF6325)
MAIGPIEYMVFGFTGATFHRDVIPVVRALTDDHTIHVLDLAFVTKAPSGDFRWYEFDADDELASAVAEIDGEVGALIGEDDLQRVAQALPDDFVAAVVVWEDTWLSRLTGAIQASGGEVLFHGPIAPDSLDDSTVALIDHPDLEPQIPTR